jgi:NADH dehydrogenase
MSDRGTSHVVVVGGGFAGVACANRLAGESGVRVTLIDRTGFHQFQPLLYQVATAELAPVDIRFDLARMFRDDANVEARTGEVVAADPHGPSVTLAGGERVDADVLVLAAGAVPNFSDVAGADRFSRPLYSLADAERLRARILDLVQDASAKPELAEEGALTFVIVGGGPTGVETAGALAELVHDVMPHRYDDLAGADAKVILLDAGHALLGAFSSSAHDYAAKQLQRRGVRLRMGVSAARVGPEEVVLDDGTTIRTRLVVWAGGERAAPLAASAGVGRGRGGRIDVQPDLTVPGFPAVYAIGDLANMPYGDEPALPQLASVAQQAGTWVARNILGDLDATGRRPFHYHDRGIMAMIGRKAAIAELGARHHELHGRLAFAAWLGVHAQLLANAHAELNAFLTWAEEFYIRPHHRSAALLDPATIDAPRIHRRRP